MIILTRIAFPPTSFSQRISRSHPFLTNSRPTIDQYACAQERRGKLRIIREPRSHFLVYANVWCWEVLLSRD